MLYTIELGMLPIRHYVGTNEKKTTQRAGCKKEGQYFTVEWYRGGTAKEGGEQRKFDFEPSVFLSEHKSKAGQTHLSLIVKNKNKYLHFDGEHLSQ